MGEGEKWPKNADIIKNMLTDQIFLDFMKVLRVLVVCQKLAVKHDPIKS